MADLRRMVTRLKNTLAIFFKGKIIQTIDESLESYSAIQQVLFLINFRK